eukprot:gene26223-biopygen15038
MPRGGCSTGIELESKLLIPDKVRDRHIRKTNRVGPPRCGKGGVRLYPRHHQHEPLAHGARSVENPSSTLIRH